MENSTKLNYKGTSIAMAEQKYNLKFFSVLESMGKKEDGSLPKVGMIDMLFLYVAGGGTPEKFDELVVNNTEDLMLDIMEGLSVSGFLGKEMKFDAKTARAEIKKALNTEIKASRKSGEN